MLVLATIAATLAGCTPSTGVTTTVTVTKTDTQTVSATSTLGIPSEDPETDRPVIGLSPLPTGWEEHVDYIDGLEMDLSCLGTIRPTIDATYEVGGSEIDGGHFLVFEVSLFNGSDDDAFISGSVEGESDGLPAQEVWDENLLLSGAPTASLPSGDTAKWTFSVQVRNVNDVQLEVVPLRGYAPADF